ncbi:AraC family transcriptional regulator [uncultured Microbulbifer sp.]|uniref:helix-turn-helix domain-containing protein n=1 Tax=uncultured Microbulbifer sp. TaxID=348147 RepID=UPI0026138779|nr:AraC family transcriptional regulator [uncultured Microbulbifer sp.]
MRRQQRLLKKNNVHRFHKALVRQGVDVKTIYDELGIDASVMLDEKNASVSMSKYLALMELASEHTGCRFLSANMALNPETQYQGVLGYILSNAPVFSAALSLLSQYIMLASPGASANFREASGECFLTYKIHHATVTECQQDVEGTIVQFVLMIRNMLSEQTWLPNSIYFEHGNSDSLNESTFPLACDVIFDHHFSGISFPGELLDYPITGSDPKLLELLESHVRSTPEYLAHSSSLVDQVRFQIGVNLEDREVSADKISSTLGMSRRTMHRRLSELGTSFYSLKEDIVFIRAKEYLSDTDVTITELAQKLGYSDSSSFDRGFKRMAGLTPLNYRKKYSQL